MSVTQPTETRTRNARGRGDQLRPELLDAAADLLAESGSVDGVSLRAIAARTGVSPTAVYRHFASSDDLLEAAVLWCWSEFDRKLDESLVPGCPPLECFTKMGAAYAEFAQTEPGKYAVLMHRHHDMGDAVEQAGMAVFGKLVDLVARLLDERGDDRDPFFVASQVHSWMHGIVDLCGAHDSDTPFPPAEDLIAEIPAALHLLG